MLMRPRAVSTTTSSPQCNDNVDDDDDDYDDDDATAAAANAFLVYLCRGLKTDDDDDNGVARLTCGILCYLVGGFRPLSLHVSDT